MSNNTWEADKMLDVYIHDYLLKRNFHATAKTFMAEGKVSADPVAIDAPGGFLFEWWSVFWDIFIARTNEKHSEVAAAYTETQHIMAKDQQQMQQLQYLQQKQIQQLQQRRELNTSLSGTPNVMNADNMLGQSTANALVTKMYEERLKNPHQREGDLPTQMLDPNRVALLKAASNPSGVLLQSNGHGMNTAFPQVQGRSQQLGVNVLDIKNEVNVALNQRTVTDPSVFGVPGALHSKQNLLNSGINQGAGALSVKGWPLTGIEQFRSNLGPQSHKSFMPSSQQFLQHHNLPEQQRQQILMQSQQNNGNLASPGSTFPGEMDPQRFRASMIAGMGVKDGSLTGNNCSQQGGSTLQATPSMQRASPLDQADTMKMVQMQQQSSVQLQTQQQHEQQQLQHMGTNQNQHDNMTCVLGVGSDSNNMPSVQTNDQIHNNKKRKQSSSSGIANSLGAGNNSLNSAPSPPSTHTPGDGLSTASNLNHNTNMSKNIIMYGSDGTGGLAPNSNQVVDIGPFTENGAMGENIDSYLSHGDGEPRDGLFGTVRHASVEHSTKASKSFSFREFARLHESSNKIICCHFSSDGHFLAGAGLESKTFIWNVDSLQKDSTLGEHSSPITDVRFSPNSTQLATSSVDKTVRLWDAENPSNSSCTFSGHTANVMSLDFHSQNEDLLCSCDSSSEIRYWSVSQRGNTRCFKGGTVQVRFQPSGGQYLAAAADTVVSIFDIESTSSIHSFKRHTKPVHSLCWDVTGSLLASVSEDSVRVWSLSSGDCVHELNCNGNKFHSCVFHPTYSSLLVLGCYQSLELWNMADNKCMTVPAHEGLIAALAVSPVRGLVASASHDKSIKLWK